MSKTVITSSGGQLDSQYDKRFGRAAWFCIYEAVTDLSTFHKNENINLAHDAGIKVAEKMIGWNVQKVISGDFGPRAEEFLDNHNIQMVILKDENFTVMDIINRLKGKLRLSTNNCHH
jgi:predicted Fe-Mo cluster-binding NifX family protein